METKKFANQQKVEKTKKCQKTSFLELINYTNFYKIHLLGAKITKKYIIVNKQPKFYIPLSLQVDWTPRTLRV